MPTYTGAIVKENALPKPPTVGIGYVRAIDKNGKSVRSTPVTQSFADFGCVLDGVTDDAVPAQAALTWLSGGGGNRRLVLPPDCLMRIGAPITANFGGRRGYELAMYSDIKPDAGIGDAITLVNTKQSYFYLRVAQGGQTADYTQADPVGCDQAFVIRGCRSCEIVVQGRSYLGRVLRVKPQEVGEEKTSFNVFDITVESGATKCGQALYAQGTTAFGEIRQMNDTAATYGPVFNNVTDLTIKRYEGGEWTTHMLFYQCGSVWIDELLMGATVTPYNVEFNGSYRVHVTKALVGGTPDCVLVKDVPHTGTGVVFEHLEAAFYTESAIVYQNAYRCRAHIASTNGKHAFTMDADCSDMIISLQTQNSLEQAFTIASGAYIINVSGHINGAASSPASTNPAVSIRGTGDGIKLDNLTIISSTATYLLDLDSNNKVDVIGGWWTGGVTGKFNVAPNSVRNTQGYRNEAENTAIIPNGAAFVVVNHTLATTPDRVFLTGRSSLEVSAPISSAFTSTQFTISVASAVSADRTVYWRAVAGKVSP